MIACFRLLHFNTGSIDAHIWHITYYIHLTPGCDHLHVYQDEQEEAGVHWSSNLPDQAKSYIQLPTKPTYTSTRTNISRTNTQEHGHIETNPK